MEENGKLVSTMKEVDVVISALPYPQVLDQLKIIDAIIAAGNIKVHDVANFITNTAEAVSIQAFLLMIQRFMPSDFGCEEDRIRALPPFEAFLEKKRKIRRAIESAGIPFTYLSANCCGAYFVNILLHPHDRSREDVIIYGTGKAKGRSSKTITTSLYSSLQSRFDYYLLPCGSIFCYLSRF